MRTALLWGARVRDWAYGLRRFWCHFDGENMADHWVGWRVEIESLVGFAGIWEERLCYGENSVRLIEMERFCWKLWWRQWLIVVSSSSMTGNIFVVVKIVLFWGDWAAENVWFVKIEFWLSKLRRIESKLLQVSRSSSGIDLGAEIDGNKRKYCASTMERTIFFCVRFEWFWVVLCASTMSST